MSWTGNVLLAQFGPDIEIIRPQLRPVTLAAGQLLCEPGEQIRHVYFPDSGLVSKLTVFEDGTEIEVALIGREGAVGAMSTMGVRTAVTRGVCHVPAAALMIEPRLLHEAMKASARIHDTLDRYCARKMHYAIRSGACNATHSLDQRLCRWLLSCSDLLESREIHLPQEVFAKMLGVQRSSVNPILQRMREDGLVELARGRVTLLDRDGLRSRVCECYEAMKATDASLRGPESSSSA